MDKKLIFNEHGDRGTQSMIGGNTTNLREWNRIKYDWANQMYRTMLNNFWIPEEISLNEDVKQFPYLTDYERRAFDKIIARTDNLGLYSILSPRTDRPAHRRSIDCIV